jgi:Fic family protein
MDKNVLYFLEESNHIEGVYDADSLNQAVYAWQYLMECKKLTRTTICKTHKILMLHQPLLPSERGYLRQVDVLVGGQIKRKWREIPEVLDIWVKDMNETIKEVKNKGIYPLLTEELSKKLHVQYEDIHPFIDGNGRTGRMFMNWWRLQCGLPLMIIAEQDRREYYSWFK